MKRFVARCLCAWVLLVGGLARADKTTDAEELFRRAKTLMADKRDAEACPLLEESQRLDPQMGTLLNLAICHENVGRIASAWGEYRAVEQMARAARRDDRVKLAEERVARLEPRVPHLRLVVPPEAKVPGMVVRIDQEPKSEPIWPSIPVDPGLRVLEVQAPGKRTFSTRVKIDGEGTRVTVKLPKLEDAPVERPPVAERATSDRREQAEVERNRARRTAGFVAGGLGLAVVAAGGVFGVLAMGADSAAQDMCPAPCLAGSSQAAAADQETDRALVFANVANVAVPLGVVALAVGAYLVLSAGPTERRVAWRTLGLTW